MNNKLNDNNYLLLGSDLNVCDTVYQKLVSWDEAGKLWLENNDSTEKVQALKIFINKFLVELSKQNIEIPDFLDSKVYLFNINDLLDNILLEYSEKLRKYYRNHIINFLESNLKNKREINILHKSYLFKEVKEKTNNNWAKELDYIFEWNDIPLNMRLSFVVIVYEFFYSLNEFKNIKEILYDKDFSIIRIKKLFGIYIDIEEKLSEYHKKTFKRKFIDFIRWTLNNKFIDRSKEVCNRIILNDKNFLINKLGSDWGDLQEIVNEWLMISKRREKYKASLKKFFYNAFNEGDNQEKFIQMILNGGDINLIELMRINNKCSEASIRVHCTHIIYFLNWYIDKYVQKKGVINPFIIFTTRNPFYDFLVTNGIEWNNWLILAHQWLIENPKGRVAKIPSILAMLEFFKENKKNYSNVNLLIHDIQNNFFKYSDLLGIIQLRWSERFNYNTNHLCNFINWILGRNINSLKLKRIEIESLNFNWVLIDYGREWLGWVLLAERWLEISKENLSHKKRVLKTFFINYLVKTTTYGDVEMLFKGTQNWSMNEKDLIQKLGNVSPGSLKHKRSYFTTLVTFLDWVADNVLSSKILNPISKNIFKDNEPIYLLISTLGPMWSEWGILIKKWMIDDPKVSHRKIVSPMKVFFNYLKNIEKNNGCISDILDININIGKINREKYYNYLNNLGYTKSSIRFYVKWPSKFFDYLVKKEKNTNYMNPLAVTSRTGNLRKWFVHTHGIEWKIWCNYAEEWLSNHKRRSERTSIVIFFENYLLNRPCKSNVINFFRGIDKWIVTKEDLTDVLKSCTIQTLKTYFHNIKKFTFWVFNRYYSELRYESIFPPFGGVYRVLCREKNKFQWLIDEYGEKWTDWANLANEWVLSNQANQGRYITSLSRFFEYYLVSFEKSYLIDNVILSKEGVLIDKDLFTKILDAVHESNTTQSINADCLRFFNWIIKKNYINLINRISNPFGILRPYDGRTTDIEFKWVVNLYGNEWEEWRALAAGWISTHTGSLSQRMRSIAIFIESFLIQIHPGAYSVEKLLSGSLEIFPKNEDLFIAIKNYTNISIENNINNIINHVVKFIDWILFNHFSVENNHGFIVPKYINPFDKAKTPKIWNESVHSPLPYNYVRALIKKICPHDFGSFRDWSWAYSSTNSKIGGGWYDVPKELIDFDDTDCVWRKLTVKGKYPFKNTEKYQLWSPAAAIGVLLKLHLPLRTFQARMLDSGEADYERYEKGKWIKNPNQYARPNLSRGVFKKITEYNNNEIYTGFYINTNKTADINKMQSEKGYIIPWENKIVLYWLEKLRNWQEKYNPSPHPIPCTELDTSHFGQIIAEETLKNMGSICFLLRHAAAKNKADRLKPVLDRTLNSLWLKLLIDFEEDIANEGQTFSDSSRIKFVEISPNSKRKRYLPLFPLHSLRVSFITSYLQDGKVPLPILSKLLAGHSSLLMTLYYAKISPNHMQTIISNAQDKMEKNKEEDLRLFLKDHDINEIYKKMVFQDKVSIAAILQGRNILGWEQKHHGICLAAGNTLDIRDSYDNTRNAGCWNGGRPSEIEDKNQRLSEFEPVPHGAGNCVRCRWFITHANYIPQLIAHFNILSYKANLSAVAARKANEAVIELEKKKQNCLQEKKLFNEDKELERLLKEYKLELSEADEYCKDIIATLNIIERINAQESNRETNDENQKVIAVGNREDVEFAFLETKSELLHLCILCDDAEIYPDLYNKLNKTPAIERRTRIISKMMLKKGYQPHYLFLSEEEQFKVINSMIREMSKHMNKLNRFDSFRLLVERLEQENSNSFKGILNDFLDKNENRFLKLTDINDREED